MRSFTFHIVLVFGSLLGSLCGFAQAPGSPDLRFGQKGRMVLDVDQDERISRVLTDNSGNLYLLGQTMHYGDSPDLDYLVCKLNAEGELVREFGQNGILRGDFGRFRNSRIVDAAMGADAIFLLGEGNNAGAQDTQQVYVAKIDLMGRLATEFADQGIFTRRFLGEYASAGAIRVLQDGRIVFCGMTTDTLAWHIEEPLFARLLPNGRADSSLAGTGCVAWSLAHGLASVRVAHNDGGKFETILPMDGGYLLGGVFYTSNYGRALLMRITEAGELDDGFGENGLLRPDINPGYTCVVTDAYGMGDEIVLGATLEAYQQGEDFALLRMDTLGTRLDYQSLDFQAHEDRLSDMLVDADGRLLLAGSAQTPSASPLAPESNAFAVAAMLDWENMDQGFAENGLLLAENHAAGAGATALLQTQDGGLIVAGWVSDGSTDDFSDLLIIKLLLDSAASSPIPPVQASESIIYPNPTQSHLFFEPVLSCSVSIFDAQGKIVLRVEAPSNGIDVSALQAGIYLIQANGQSWKMIKH